MFWIKPQVGIMENVYVVGGEGVCPLIIVISNTNYIQAIAIIKNVCNTRFPKLVGWRLYGVKDMVFEKKKLFHDVVHGWPRCVMACIERVSWWTLQCGKRDVTTWWPLQPKPMIFRVFYIFKHLNSWIRYSPSSSIYTFRNPSLPSMIMGLVAWF